MKKIKSNCFAMAFASLLAATGIASAQTTTTTSTSSTTSAGTVTDFSPAAITVRSETSSSPVSYSFSKTTTYVDEAGNPVSVETVKSGVPVTVYYTRDGDQMLASKVVVRKTVTADAPPVIETKKTTTTTTSSSGE